MDRRNCRYPRRFSCTASNEKAERPTPTPWRFASSPIVPKSARRFQKLLRLPPLREPMAQRQGSPGVQGPPQDWMAIRFQARIAHETSAIKHLNAPILFALSTATRNGPPHVGANRQAHWTAAERPIAPDFKLRCEVWPTRDGLHSSVLEYPFALWRPSCQPPLAPIRCLISPIN